MVYAWIYELVTTLFIDISLLSAELLFMVEVIMLFLTILLIRFFLIPIFYLFRISASVYRNILPKDRIRKR